MEKRVFQCHKISEGIVKGEAVVSKDDTVFYLIDSETGTVIEPGHDLKGKSVTKKVLVFPSGKGSSVMQADGIYQLSTRGNAPRAMIIQHPETVLISSAVVMEIPVVDGANPTFYDVVKGGDVIYVDTDHSVVGILSE